LRKTAVIIAVLLLIITGFCVITGEYYKITDIDSRHYTLHRTTLNKPITPQNPLYPWLETHFDYSIWDHESVNYRFPTGVKNPGKTIEINYGIEETGEGNQNITIVYRFIELGETPEIMEEKTEHVMGPPYSCKWLINIPETAPMKYSLGVIAYDSEGRILDGMVSRITVPKQELVASMHVEPSNIVTEKIAKLVMENHGESNLEFGTIYRYEKYENSKWVSVPSKYFWALPLFRLSPGGIFDSEINVKGLDSGRYRVLKEMDAEGTELEETLVAEFTVDRPKEPCNQIPEYGYRYTWGLSRESIESPDRSMLQLINLGARALYFDSIYALDVKQGEEWVRYYENNTQSQITVKRGETYKLKLGIPDMPPGDYRLIVTFGIEGTTATETLMIMFDR